MSTEHRRLLMNANRRLGAALVEHNLVKIEGLEQANERLLEIVATNQPRKSTILGGLAEVEVGGSKALPGFDVGFRRADPACSSRFWPAGERARAIVVGVRLGWVITDWRWKNLLFSTNQILKLFVVSCIVFVSEPFTLPLRPCRSLP